MISSRPTVTDLDSSSPEPIIRVRLESPRGYVVETCNLGAAIHRLWWPSPTGAPTNVVLGYETLDEYKKDPFFLGVTVGRVANRIADGRFSLKGRSYELETNDPPHHLHGGSQGWFRRVWKLGELYSEGGSGVRFDLDSPDGDAGYPGRVQSSVSYFLDDDALHVVMTATTDQLTLVNLAHHSYFNLAGHGDVLGHELELMADHFTPELTTGRLVAVDRTPLDLRKPRRVGAELPAIPGYPTGYDHNVLLRTHDRGASFIPENRGPLGPRVGALPVAARLTEPMSGRRLELSTNQPALQFYSGNYLDGRAGTPTVLRKHAGLCLESQAVPNFPNVPTFAEQGTLEPGQIYRHEMLFRFGTR